MNAEREALIADLRELVDLHTWAKDVTEQAADMLAADAQQVAVPPIMSDEGLRDIERAYVSGWNACREKVLTLPRHK